MTTTASTTLRRIDDARMTPLLWRIVAFTVLGMFVDGYILVFAEEIAE